MSFIPSSYDSVFKICKTKLRPIEIAVHAICDIMDIMQIIINFTVDKK